MTLALCILLPTGIALFIAAMLNIRATQRRNREWDQMVRALESSRQHSPFYGPRMVVFRDGKWVSSDD